MRFSLRRTVSVCAAAAVLLLVGCTGTDSSMQPTPELSRLASGTEDCGSLWDVEATAHLELVNATKSSMVVGVTAIDCYDWDSYDNPSAMDGTVLVAGTVSSPFTLTYRTLPASAGRIRPWEMEFCFVEYGCSTMSPRPTFQHKDVYCGSGDYITCAGSSLCPTGSSAEGTLSPFSLDPNKRMTWRLSCDDANKSYQIIVTDS